MVGALDYRATPLREKADAARKKPKMPEGPGVHIKVDFGGEVAERGRKILEPPKVPGQAPKPASEDRCRLPDYDDVEDTAELSGEKALKVQGMLKAIAEDYVDNNRPTRPIPGRDKMKVSEKPVCKVSEEERMLSRDSDVSRSTTSFAPPPPIPSPVVEENLTSPADDNVVRMDVAKNWVPPRKREQNQNP